MAVDPEVLESLRQAVEAAGQGKDMESAMAAWLKAMSESDLSIEDNMRYLGSVKHSVRTTQGTGRS